MKRNMVRAIAIAILIGTAASCTVLQQKKLPPGQAKKLTGQQNASSLAPGKK